MSARSRANWHASRQQQVDFLRHTLDTAAAQQRALSHACLYDARQTERQNELQSMEHRASAPTDEAAVHVAVAIARCAGDTTNAVTAVGGNMNERDYNDAVRYAEELGKLDRLQIAKRAVDEYRAGTMRDYGNEIEQMRAYLGDMWSTFDSKQKAMLQMYKPGSF
jgi:hypothetical protein